MSKRNRNKRAQLQNRIAASTTKERMTKHMGNKIKEAKKAAKAAKTAAAVPEQQERPTINIPLTIEQYQLIDAMISMAMQKGEKKLLIPLAQLHITLQQHGATFEKEMQRKAVLKEMEGEAAEGKKNDKLKSDVEKAVGKKPANDDGDDDEDESSESGEGEK